MRNRLIMGLTSAAVLTLLNAGAAYAQDPALPLPPSIILVVTGAAAVGFTGWWRNRK